jgi:hypothetical protein
MKKFNQAKWEALQQRKDNLHQIYHSKREDAEHASQNYTQSLAVFFTHYKNHRILLNRIENDGSTLSAADIEAKLNRLRTHWAGACVEFELSAEFNGRHHLIDLYELMLKQRKLSDIRAQAARKQQEFGACFGVLNDFASQHGQGDHSRNNAVPVKGLIY